MTLATVGADGAPSARVVLLRGVDERGLVFHTNRESRKAADLAANPQAALVLHWKAAGRQVRVEGRVAPLDGERSDAYFAGRSRESRVGAWASPQSRPVAGREELERLVAETEGRFAGSDVPRPPFWGGYLLAPDRFEFWQHGEHRLHDRFRYTRGADGSDWVVERLAP